MIKSDAEIYVLIERILKDAGDDPQTVTDIWDRYPEVRESVRDTNDLSDKLGYMWRRDLLDRWYTAHTSSSRARFGYTWKEAEEGVLTPRKLEAAKATYLKPVASVGKPNVIVTEQDGSVILDFPEFTITVVRKQHWAALRPFISLQLLRGLMYSDQIRSRHVGRMEEEPSLASLLRGAKSPPHSRDPRAPRDAAADGST